MDLKQIFFSITPDNIKSIKVIEDAMNIFIENLEKNSPISKDLTNIFQSQNEELKESILKTYLKSVYDILLSAQQNKFLTSKIKEKNPQGFLPLSSEIRDVLNFEHIMVHKHFKTARGTKKAFEYSYNLSKYLESGEVEYDFELIEEKPFHYTVNGSILKETYDSIVKKMAHPIGYTYDYNQISKLFFSDLYGIDLKYDFKNIEIRCLIGGKFDVFTSDLNDSNVKADFLSRINILTGKLFTEYEYNNQVTVFTNRIVEEYTEFTVEKRIFRSIKFTNGEYLQQVSNPLEINYLMYNDYINENFTNKIKEYNSGCSLYLNYNTEYILLTNDEFKTKESFFIHKIREENNGIPDITYYDVVNNEFSFNVGGDEYQFFPGIDESNKKYPYYKYIKEKYIEYYKKNFHGISKNNSTNVEINIYDNFGNSFYYNKISEFNSVFNDYIFAGEIDLYKLKGEEYTIDLKTDTSDFIYKSNNLNKKVFVTAFLNNEDTYYCQIYGYEEYKIKSISITDGIKIISETPPTGTFQGFYDFEIETVGLNNNFIFTISFYEHPELKISGNFMNAGMDIEMFPLIYDLDYINYDSMLISNENSITEMVGLNSIPTYYYKKIGEYEDGSYANEDMKVKDYMDLHGFTQLSEIPSNIKINGAYIEGNDYNQCFSEDLIFEKSFINYGRLRKSSISSEIYDMASDDNISDDFEIEYVKKEAKYFVATGITDLESPLNYKYYIKTTDENYIIAV